jgi:hypothetical protein
MLSPCPSDQLMRVMRSAVEAAVQKGRTALVMVESPTNPRMQVRACSQSLRARNRQPLVDMHPLCRAGRPVVAALSSISAPVDCESNVSLESDPAVRPEPAYVCCQVCDIRAIARVAHAAGALVVVDNSIMAPVFQRPLDLGADICMTSATKFIGGHSDITAGTLSVRGADIAQRIYFHQVCDGTEPSILIAANHINL